METLRLRGRKRRNGRRKEKKQEEGTMRSAMGRRLGRGKSVSSRPSPATSSTSAPRHGDSCDCDDPALLLLPIPHRTAGPHGEAHAGPSPLHSVLARRDRTAAGQSRAAVFGGTDATLAVSAHGTHSPGSPLGFPWRVPGVCRLLARTVSV